LGLLILLKRDGEVEGDRHAGLLGSENGLGHRMGRGSDGASKYTRARRSRLRTGQDHDARCEQQRCAQILLSDSDPEPRNTERAAAVTCSATGST